MKKKLMIKNNKEDIILFLIVFAIAIIMIYPLLIQMHFAPDTYQVIDLGYTEYAKEYFLKSGRIITAATFFIADAIHIPYEAYVRGMEFIAILAQTFSTMILYKIFLNKITYESKLKKYMILACSFLIIFNLLALEFLLYAESGILCLSILCSVVGLKVFLNSEQKHRYIKSLAWVVLATILYQGDVNIFFTLVVLNLFLDNKKKKKSILKDIFIAGVILVIAFITTTILIFICTKLLNVQQERFTNDYNGINIISIIKSFANISIYILKSGFEFCFNNLYLYIATITMMCLFIIKKEEVLKYLFIILIAFTVCILPIYVMQDVFVNARMCMSIGAIIGISYIYILANINSKYKIGKYIFSIIIILTVFYTGYQYLQISNSNIEENKIDNEVGYAINELVNKYENMSGNIITKIAVTNDINRSFYTSKSIKNTFTERSTANYYCIKEVLQYYLNKDIKIVNMDVAIYNLYFKNKDWESFNNEQIVFKEDTMYMCIY